MCFFFKETLSLECVCWSGNPNTYAIEGGRPLGSLVTSLAQRTCFWGSQIYTEPWLLFVHPNLNWLRNSHLSLVKIVGADRKGSFYLLIQLSIWCQLYSRCWKERERRRRKTWENQILRSSKLWATVMKTKSSRSINSVYSNSQSTSTKRPNMKSLQCYIDSPPPRLPWKFCVLMKK